MQGMPDQKPTPMVQQQSLMCETARLKMREMAKAMAKKTQLVVTRK